VRNERRGGRKIAARLPVVGCDMKCVRTKYRFPLALALGLVLVCGRARRSLPYGKDWLLISTPAFGSRTTAGGITPTVSLRVSNVGPHAVEFQVWWFECRAKRDRTLLATNQLALVSIPLSPGKSTNLTMDLSSVAAPDDERLACCQVQWFERESELRRMLDRPMTWLLDIFDLNWTPPWGAQKLTNGCAFAANVGVADYFRLMHGLTRSQWLEDLNRRQSAQSERRAYSRLPTAEEMYAIKAKHAFAEFCQASTKQQAEAERKMIDQIRNKAVQGDLNTKKGDK